MASRIPGLGARHRVAREAAGYTQSDVARELGISRSMTISEWERDLYAPDAAQAIHLGRLFGVDPEWLVTGQGEGPAEAA